MLNICTLFETPEYWMCKHKYCDCISIDTNDYAFKYYNCTTKTHKRGKNINWIILKSDIIKELTLTNSTWTISAKSITRNFLETPEMAWYA